MTPQTNKAQRNQRTVLQWGILIEDVYENANWEELSTDPWDEVRDEDDTETKRLSADGSQLDRAAADWLNLYS